MAESWLLPRQGNPLLTFSELNDELLDPMYLAIVEAVAEAVVNALVAGEDVPTFKPPGRICRAIDTTALTRIFATGQGADAPGRTVGPHPAG